MVIEAEYVKLRNFQQCDDVRKPRTNHRNS
ncbi:hypothetical protein F383_27159 [Gossypium arboreum]|uniref:Uncharacterized protein n=1 Tax=Gossypium arboreum TaxID=29729 RepID=A0A0B0P9B9_GOSAR|nr:hypothetical protein F383_27159 [Gossypium arboreum]